MSPECIYRLSHIASFYSVQFAALPSSSHSSCSPHEKDCNSVCLKKYGEKFKTGVCVPQACLCELWEPVCVINQTDRVDTETFCRTDRECNPFCNDKYVGKCGQSDGKCHCVRYDEFCTIQTVGDQIYLDDAGPSAGISKTIFMYNLRR